MTDLDTVAERLDAAARAATTSTTPSAPPSDLWRRGRTRRRAKQVAAGIGTLAAAAALVVPAALIVGAGSDGSSRVADAPAGQPGPAIPDTLFPVPDDAPRVRAPGPLGVVYESATGSDAGPGLRRSVVGVSALDGQSVILPGVPASAGLGLAGAPRYALSSDGSLLAYARGPAIRPSAGDDELVVRDLRTGEELVSDLAPRLVSRISGLRPMNFSGGFLLVSVDHAPGQSLHAVDPVTGAATTLVPRGGALTYPGAASSEPVFSVGRRVYLGTAPVSVRQADYRGPSGTPGAPAAVSPSGTRLATVETEPQSDVSPDIATLRLGGEIPDDVDALRNVPGGGELEAWLPDGRIVVQLTRPTDRAGLPLQGQTWFQIVDGAGRFDSLRKLDESRVDGSTVVIASDLLAQPLRAGVEPDAYALGPAVMLSAIGIAATVVALVVWRRRASR